MAKKAKEAKSNTQNIVFPPQSDKKRNRGKQEEEEREGGEGEEKKKTYNEVSM